MMSEPTRFESEQDTEEQTPTPINNDLVCVNFDEFRWRDEENERAQRILRKLYAEREKLLAAAGVTQDNFAEKVLHALDSKNDWELAKAIMGKFVLSPEQEIRVFPPDLLFSTGDESAPGYSQSTIILLPREPEETE